MSRSVSVSQLRRPAVLGVLLLLSALTVIAFASSTRWLGATFPGFFLMDNRVVPSIGLSHWTGMRAGNLYQHQVVTVDDEAVAQASTVYRRVAGHPVGTIVRYGLQTGGAVEEHAIASMRFAFGDYLLTFGALLLNGVVFAAVGIGVWILGPRAPATIGTALLTLTVGVFCLSAMDLYGPAWFFRLHVVSEALIPITLLHLTLVFPVRRLASLHGRTLVGLYGLAAVLVAVYEWRLYDADAYSAIHNLCTLAMGIVGVGFIASGIQAYVTSTSQLVRKRLGIIALGAVVGFAIPAWILTWSSIAGGDQAINIATFTAFLFPVSLAYAVVKHDLFEIDAMLRRGLEYLALTGTIVAFYAALVLTSSFALQGAAITESPAFPLVFSVLVIALFHPLRVRIQRVVDRLYHRTGYSAQVTLERASSALMATLELEDICTLTVETICQALLVDDVALWIRSGAEFRAAFAGTSGAAAPPAIPAIHPILQRLRATNRPLASYEFADEAGGAADAAECRAAFDALGAEIVLPIGSGDLVGALVLGPKRSHAMYSSEDVGFLATFANQIAIAISNARAYREIEDLNTGLERKVTERTGELASANAELARSLRERERAYRELERSQENLVRAEKMAALGRLTAGIAHEINTPLGASLNALTVVEQLLHEYASSIGDPSVTETDHQEIAGELTQQVANVTTWTTKAASYIRSIKAHTRSLDQVEQRRFDLAQLIEDARLLLDHRLRLSSCVMEVACPSGVTLVGDPGKLAQALTNLITNAVDAYEGQSRDGVVRVDVRVTDTHVVIGVEDEGCGIPAPQLERIFEELYTTKDPGKGTGLGLAISRDIVVNCFRGRIDVSSTPGRGSRFTLTIPHEATSSARDQAGVAVPQ